MKQNKAKVIGITGGVGCGKSTVLDYLFENYDCLIIKADDIGNEVKLKGHECYDDILNLFGTNILDDNEEIDKKKLALLIFNDDSLLKNVNNIIHPAVRKVIESFIEDNSMSHDYLFIEAALLVEANYFPILDELWYIDSDADIRINRLMNTRGYSKDKCISIINNQHDVMFYRNASSQYIKDNPDSKFRGYREFVNNSDICDLYCLIDKAMEELNG